MRGREVKFGVVRMLDSTSQELRNIKKGEEEKRNTMEADLPTFYVQSSQSLHHF